MLFTRKDPAPSVAIGTGRYGDPVLIPCSELKKPIGIFGTSRSGKTRLATSVADQQSRQLGAGQIVIDFKGDADLVRRKAELARQLGRTFLHFQLVEKGGGRYERVHPYCPPQRAHYDPFARGNGASKASMLLNSVPRDGDAAAYVRRAFEAVQLAWDLAALKGWDQRRQNSRPLSGLEVLAGMLSKDSLVGAGKSLTVEEVLAAADNTISRAAAEERVRHISTRLQALESELADSRNVLAGAIGDTSSLISSFLNSSSLGGNLTPGLAPSMRIDLVRAILRQEIVVFSLSAQDYPDTAAQVGTMILLDMQNAVSTLRARKNLIAKHRGTDLSAADSNPWPPLVLQMEEVSSLESEAAGTALIGLLNKSADVGIRTILSSQSIGDLVNFDDGRGVFVRRLFGQMDHLFSLQMTASEDTEAFAKESNEVDKNYPIEDKLVERNRFRFGQGAGETSRIRANPQRETRIPSRAVAELAREDATDTRELLYIKGGSRAVHTVLPEGPNNWYEVLRMVTVLEKPHGWNPADDPECADAEQAMEAQQEALFKALNPNGMLAAVLSNRADAFDIPAAAVTATDAAMVPEADPEELDAEDEAAAEAEMSDIFAGTSDDDDDDPFS